MQKSQPSRVPSKIRSFLRTSAGPPCTCSATRAFLALKSSATRRGVRDVRQRVLDFRSISIRAIAVIEGGKSIGRRSGWPFRFNGPRLKRPVPVRQHAFIRSCARVRASAQYRFFASVATSGGAWLPGLPGITGELSPIGKKAKCFPLEQHRGTRERYIHKCRRDARHCVCIRDLRFLLVLSFSLYS